MPIVNIITWPTSAKIKRNLMDKLTRVIHEETRAPLDKITVYFQEISKDNWSEGGAIGSDEYFPEMSRRKTYTD